MSDGDGGCECDASGHFVANGDRCECDSENNFVLNSQGQCEYCDPVSCAPSTGPRSRIWYLLGQSAFSASNDESPYSVVVGGNNVPYVLLGGDINVMAFKDNSWTTIGDGDTFTNAGVTFHSADMKADPLDPNGLYVAYSKGALGASVKRYDGRSWKYVGGQSFSESNSVAFITIAVASDGTPYVGFVADADSQVRRLNDKGDGWESIGNTGFSENEDGYMRIALDSSDVPYIVKGVSTIAAFKLVEGSWQGVGSAPIHSGNDAYVNGFVIGSDDILYVSYDDPYNDREWVKKYDASLDEWVFVGEATSPLIGFYGPMSTGFALGPNDTLSIVATSKATGGVDGDVPTVWVFDTGSQSWKNLGNRGLGVAAGYYAKIAFGKDGTAYVATKILYADRNYMWLYN